MFLYHPVSQSHVRIWVLYSVTQVQPSGQYSIWSMFKRTDEGFMRCFTGIYHPLGFCLLTRVYWPEHSLTIRAFKVSRHVSAWLHYSLSKDQLPLSTSVHAGCTSGRPRIWLCNNTNLTWMVNWAETQLKDKICFSTWPGLIFGPLSYGYMNIFLNCSNITTLIDQHFISRESCCHISSE